MGATARGAERKYRVQHRGAPPWDASGSVHGCAPLATHKESHERSGAGRRAHGQERRQRRCVDGRAESGICLERHVVVGDLEVAAAAGAGFALGARAAAAAPAGRAAFTAPAQQDQP